MVVATDGSPHAEHAVLWVARWANRLADTEVTLINVGDVRLLAERMKRGGTDILAHAAQAFTAQPGKVKTVYRSGDPAEEILKLAREIHADLIVLGRRGLGRIGGLMRGSVSDRVLHGAHCAVLIAREVPVVSRAHPSGGM